MVAILWKGEDTPHPIPDNIITVLILVGLDEDLQMSIYRNYIKPDISSIILFIYPIYYNTTQGYKIGIYHHGYDFTTY